MSRCRRVASTTSGSPPSGAHCRGDGTIIPGPVLDEDYFLVDAPQPGQRLVISTNATDGQIALALFSSSEAQASLVEGAATPVPGTAVTEQNGDAGAPAESGGDAAAPLAGHTLVDQAVVSGGGSEQLEAASTDADPGAQLLLRVTSGDGKPSSSLYSLRARYVDEPAESVCPAWEPAQTADPGVIGASDAITDTTNTLYLFDQERFGDTHGAAAAAAVRRRTHEPDRHGSRRLEQRRRRRAVDRQRPRRAAGRARRSMPTPARCRRDAG